MRFCVKYYFVVFPSVHLRIFFVRGFFQSLHILTFFSKKLVVRFSTVDTRVMVECCSCADSKVDITKEDWVATGRLQNSSSCSLCFLWRFSTVGGGVWSMMLCRAIEPKMAAVLEESAIFMTWYAFPPSCQSLFSLKQTWNQIACNIFTQFIWELNCSVQRINKCNDLKSIVILIELILKIYSKCKSLHRFTI